MTKLTPKDAIVILSDGETYTSLAQTFVMFPTPAQCEQLDSGSVPRQLDEGGRLISIAELVENFLASELPDWLEFEPEPEKTD